MTPASLTPQGEQVWLRLKKHIEWTDGFCLGFIFSEHPPVINLFRERLVDIFRLRVTQLQFLLPVKPEELTEFILRRIVHPFAHETAHSGPVWIDLSTHSEPGWPEGRLNFIARLNEHREPMRKNLGKPLLLIFPLAEKAPLRAMAPDLWSIRSFTIDISGELFTIAAEAPVVERQVEPVRREATGYDRTILGEWERLLKGGDRSRGILLPGSRAVDVLLKLGKHTEAKLAADYLLPLAREIVKKDPEALRDLSISLDNVGKTAQALGQWDNARQAFDESLDLRRRILKNTGETPQALRDLSVSLNNVGKTAQALGQWDNARQAFEESLDLRRRILKNTGETPEALRDLSVSLNNVGKTAQALGQWDNARQAFEESLDLRRRILKNTGETPEALRDLSVSLDNVGKTAQALGQWDNARQAFEESLDLRRRILKNTGEAPEALRDLSVSLNNVGKTAQALGQRNNARAAFEEAMAIGKLLSSRFPQLTDYAGLADIYTKRLADLDSAIATVSPYHDNNQST